MISAAWGSSTLKKVKKTRAAAIENKPAAACCLNHAYFFQGWKKHLEIWGKQVYYYTRQKFDFRQLYL